MSSKAPVLLAAVAAFSFGLAVAYLVLSDAIENAHNEVVVSRRALVDFVATAQSRHALEDLRASTAVIGLVVAAQKNGSPSGVLSSDLSRYLEERIESLRRAPASSDSASSANIKAALDSAEKLQEDIKWAY